MPPDPATALWYNAWNLGGIFVLTALVIAFAGVVHALWRSRPRTPQTEPVILDPTQQQVSRVGMAFFVGWGLFSAVGLATIGFYHQHIWESMDRSRRVPTVVEVMGLQYNWAFRTPGPDGKFGSIHTPLQSAENPFGIALTDPASADDEVAYGTVETTAGIPVTFLIRSLDVLHSFYLPEFRNQVTAFPGRTAHFTVQPGGPANYTIACNQFCGLGHYRMNAVWKVVPPSVSTTARD